MFLLGSGQDLGEIDARVIAHFVEHQHQIFRSGVAVSEYTGVREPPNLLLRATWLIQEKSSIRS